MIVGCKRAVDATRGIGVLGFLIWRAVYTNSGGNIGM